MIGFGWAPDILDGGQIARNVYPKNAVQTREGKFVTYGPMPGPVTVGVPPLPSKMKGLWHARGATGGWKTFAATKQDLWELVAGAWVSRTRLVGGAYNCPDDEYWSGGQAGTKLIVSNFNDDPQVIDVDAGAANFANVGGSAPKARIIQVSSDFVHALGMPTDPYSDRWSAFRNPLDWVTSSVTQALSAPFQIGGRVMARTGDKTGFLFQERAVQAFEDIPESPYVYRYTVVEGARGCVSPWGVTGVADAAFWLAEDDFYSISMSGGLKPLGAKRMIEWWRANTDAARQFQVMAVADPVFPRVMWAGYASAASANFDRLVIYDWQIDDWAYSDQEAQIWAAIAAPGQTLEGLDAISGTLEGLPASLDSRVWEGTRPSFGGISADGDLMFMSGEALEATFVTARVQLNPGARSFVTEAEFKGDATEASLRVGARERMGNTATYGSAVSMDARGKFPLRSSARIHEFEVTIPAGSAWTEAQGLDVAAVPDGDR